MKILVVDDDRGTLETLSVYLGQQNCEVETAATGDQAVRKAAAGGFGLVLLDIRLPDMHGMEVLRRLRKMDPNLPVVMITAYKDAEEVVECFREGAVDCLLKPFNFDYLRNNVLPRALRKLD